MHTVIAAIVYAKDRREALLRARGIFDWLVEDNVFDYYTLFNENRPASGKSRWGRLPVVAKADSRIGKRFIEDKWQATRSAFYDNDATGIQTEYHLTNVLNKWHCLYEEKGKVNPNRNKQVWIVPADVHL